VKIDADAALMIVNLIKWCSGIFQKHA